MGGRARRPIYKGSLIHFREGSQTLTLTSGGSRGGARGPPLFLDKTEARRAKNLLFETARHPPPPPPFPYLRVWMTVPSPELSEGLDPPLLTRNKIENGHPF